MAVVQAVTNCRRWLFVCPGTEQHFRRSGRARDGIDTGAGTDTMVEELNRKLRKRGKKKVRVAPTWAATLANGVCALLCRIGAYCVCPPPYNYNDVHFLRNCSIRLYTCVMDDRCCVTSCACSC